MVAFVCLVASASIALAFPQIVRHLLDAAFISANAGLLNKIALGLLALFGDTVFFLISAFLLYRPMVAARLHGEPAPDKNDEYRFYQALIGVWPAELAADVAVAGDHNT